ncbi:right-handed parallel beta-helix repeat-containing protein [Microlunatus sp. Y2014]|uniref:right-handed parallel beta-helix repeat-containing protein n=1 Tax=Microlunatus sp. Y2014 TaxID=3418488 RepID=UPI003DA762EC
MTDEHRDMTGRRGLVRGLAAGGIGLAGLGLMAKPAHADEVGGPFVGAVVNVKDVGAIGDGVADDTAALQRAIATADPGDGIFFPPGNYVIRQTLRPKAGQVFFSHARRATITSVNGSFVMFVCRSGPVQFHHLRLDGRRADTAAPAQPDVVRAILVQASETNPNIDLVVNDCHVVGAWGTGIETVGARHEDDRVVIADTTVEGCGFYGIQLRFTHHGSIRGCTLRKNRHGFGGDEVRHVHVEHTRAVANDRHGILFIFSQDWHVDSCWAERNSLVMAGGSGIVSGGVFRDPMPPVNSDYSITNNVCVGNGTAGITIDPAVRQEPAVIQRQRAVVAGNVCRDADKFHGINVTHARDVTIVGNICEGNPYSGIQLASASHVMVEGNTCRDNQFGIGLSSNTVVDDPGHHHIGPNHLYDNDVDINHEIYQGAYPMTDIRQVGLHGSVEPEGVVMADPGTQYEQHRGHGGSLWVKESGRMSTTGWRRMRGSVR